MTNIVPFLKKEGHFCPWAFRKELRKEKVNEDRVIER